MTVVIIIVDNGIFNLFSNHSLLLGFKCL